MSLLHTLKFIVNHPLNRNRPFDALLRFVKWQIGSRLVPGEILCSWIDNIYFVAAPGDTGITGNIYCTLDEFDDMAYVLHVMSPSDIFIDIGANVGSYTLLACGVRGGRGYCFEPVPSTYKRLLVNLQVNDLLGRVRPFNMALAEKDGEILFTSNENTTNHILAENENCDSCISVNVTSLDAALSGVSPSLLKIDVEGYETLVLQGAKNVLNSSALHSVIIELNGCGTRYGFNEASIISNMEAFGFNTYRYEPFQRKLIPLYGKINPKGNTIFIKNTTSVEGKLAAAPRLNVGNHTI